MNVLVAGGAGYIGSHTVKRLKESGHTPVIYDNASRGHKAVAGILQVPAVWADLNERATLTKTLRDHKIDCVMHFAAYAYVGESVEKPLMYYWNNVATTISVLEQSGKELAASLKDLDQGIKLWKWFILAALVFLILEILLIRTIR